VRTSKQRQWQQRVGQKRRIDVPSSTQAVVKNCHDQKSLHCGLQKSSHSEEKGALPQRYDVYWNDAYERKIFLYQLYKGIGQWNWGSRRRASCAVCVCVCVRACVHTRACVCVRLRVCVCRVAIAKYRFTLFRRVRVISKSGHQLRYVCLCVHLSVCQHGTVRMPLEEFSCNLIFEYFSKIGRENSSFIKIWQE
jgi:hypothetical protein